MKTVEAIKDEQQLLTIKSYLKNRSARDYCLFMLGINTGIRIYDLLHLYVKDFICEETDEIYHFMKSSVHTDPPVYLNKHVRESLQSCRLEGSLQLHDYLFKSRKTNEPITRQQAYRIINEAAKQAGISGSIGTHTLRKTFGYHAYKKGIAISLIQKRLQHITPSETRQYIGVTKEPSVQIKLDVNL
ncbi:tyrosine-type recombinase/integrase [Metabacillus sediminilitoris]|uniref:DNA integration/recombination/inversion protein n=1 Tax=Metabacillus sediminilitoris TaxID=2567941 RepID=A0A4S4BU25_9BACI|nr:tyrosine-type recombinase/integrase [Metabacillus sediminilitoris]QGQ44952.1 tyrosine-type recombinase/integrase [Metabacillus sediminilitoris]THF78585.1 DNA integration/recombination/inversion protein [Metabacillus sediminilitoris]